MRKNNIFPRPVKVLRCKNARLSPNGVVLNRNGKPLTKSDNPRDWRYRY